MCYNKRRDRNSGSYINRLRDAYRWLRWFIVHPRPIASVEKVLLHVGCGLINDPDFINIDAYPYPHVHCVRDIRSPRMWNDGGADLIYACHVFEHLERSALHTVLRNWYRFLKPGGVLRLSVPNFDAVLRIYELSGRDVSEIAPPLMGGQLNALDFHHSIFNRAYLQNLLIDAGFRQVRDWDPMNGAHHNFNDWADFRWSIGDEKVPVSLNLEAVK
jgi:predicted SAM-dependent methyltransferase